MQFSPKRILTLYRNEFDKQVQQRFPYIALALLLLAGLLMARNADLITSSIDLTGFVILILGVILAITSFIPLLVIIFCSTLVAGEISTGTSRLILTRSVTRFEFLTAKLLIGLSFAFLLIVFYTLVLIVGGFNKFTFEPVVEDGFVLATRFDLIKNLCFALLLTMIPMSASVAYALLISVLCKNLNTSIGTTVGIIAAIDIFKHLLRFGDYDLKGYIFTTYMSNYFEVVQDMAMGLDVVWFDPKPEPETIIVPLVSLVVFLAIAYWKFLTTDVHE